MPHLPSQLVYNDLSGDEIVHILQERFAQLLANVPYLKKHITLPRVKMTLSIGLEVWADQPNPETHDINDRVEIRGEQFGMYDEIDASSKGQPPDKIREDHGIAPPTPYRGQIAIEDRTEPFRVENTRMTMPTGAIVDRTGQNSETGARNATVVVQDFGAAGLASGQFTRPSPEYRNQQQRDGGPTARPNWNNRE